MFDGTDHNGPTDQGTSMTLFQQILRISGFLCLDSSTMVRQNKKRSLKTGMGSSFFYVQIQCLASFQG